MGVPGATEMWRLYISLSRINEDIPTYRSLRVGRGGEGGEKDVSKHDTRYTYNIILRRIRATIVAVENHEYCTT
jgi:hypothetical protein